MRMAAAVAVAGLALGLSAPGWAAATASAVPGDALRQDIQLAPPKLGRSVHGTVMNAVNQPIAQAIVYLKEVGTKSVHTVITNGQGDYSFYDLKPNTSYEVYAVWKGHKSQSRTDSQYNSQTKVRLDLTIPVA